MNELIEKLKTERLLTREEFCRLIDGRDEATAACLAEAAQKVQLDIYGNRVFIRGLIEFTNYCKNDCFYCGIRRSNPYAARYRLTKEEILNCCETGYLLGFRTFVLQGGEDPALTDEFLTDLISALKQVYKDCALTLSLGERSEASYRALFESGADRYLLRHETADAAHYSRLHPPSLLASHRKECLFSLRRIGFQVGSGFMVGSPFQTTENLADDLLFLSELQPHMIGIGPFIPHKDTPFRDFASGSGSLTTYLLSILRLMFPGVLLPATTALGTLDPMGREKAILAGANVVMPNLSPIEVRKKYMLYNDKIATGDESAQMLEHLRQRVHAIGYEITCERGDSKIPYPVR